PARTLDLLLRARLVSGEDAHAAGFVSEVCDDEALDATVDQLVTPLLEHAPLSMWATKEAVRRIRRAQVPGGDDIVGTVFGSEDFRAAVKAFVAKEAVEWAGR
ncbi:MAG: enoyl-CoA hydratase, partial [Nocardioidaceae bacterium]